MQLRRTSWRHPLRPTACRIAAANGPLTRTTDDSATTLCGRIDWGTSGGGTYETSPVTLIDAWNDRAANAGAAASVTRKPQRPAPRFAHQLEAGGRMLRPLDDHMLEQIAEAGFDRALVALPRPRGSRRSRPAG